MENPLNILLLCNRPVKNADASTVTDHLDAFLRFSKHNVTQLSFIRHLPKQVKLDRFDIIVIHYSIAIGYMSEHYLDQQAKEKIRNFQGLKIVFIQDEYRSVNCVLDTLSFIGVDVIFTCVPDDQIEKVYPSSALPLVTKVNTLTGYVPKELTQRIVPKIEERLIDIGYRTRKPPYWLGELGYEKWMISERFEQHIQETDIKSDLSYRESQRIYGNAWIDFVSSCKTMLGVESGASVFDFTGNLQKNVDEYVEKYPNATFQEVQEKYLRPYEGLIKLNQISPRCFEAAALRTTMILFEGEYSKILHPNRHYISLKKNFSNIDEVILKLKDQIFLQKIADQAYQEIALNPLYSYESFISNFDSISSQEFKRKNKTKPIKSYNPITYTIDLILSTRYVTQRTTSIIIQKILLGTSIRKLLFNVWGTTPLNIKNILRPLLRIVGR